MNRITAPCLRERKLDGDRIAMLTAYDYPSAKVLDECDVDAILVGDSCAMAVMGRPDTTSMTMDEMLHHVRMVTAAVQTGVIVIVLTGIVQAEIVEDQFEWYQVAGLIGRPVAGGLQVQAGSVVVIIII